MAIHATVLRTPDHKVRIEATPDGGRLSVYDGPACVGHQLPDLDAVLAVLSAMGVDLAELTDE